MQFEREVKVPHIPDDQVRKVVERRYQFSEVVRELSSMSINSCLGMRAVRDELLYRVDQMVQDDEADRFSQQPLQPLAVSESLHKLECMYFVKN